MRLASLKAVRITSGEMHTCVVDAAGVALCWGANDYGQTGIGTSSSLPTPTPVAGGHQFVQIAAGRRHTCGITTDADAYCWGLDHAGQLGAGDVSSDRCAYWRDPCSRVPRLVVGGHKWAQLAASEKATCGLTTDGEMYCWGLEVGASDGRYCQLPDNFVGCTRASFRIAPAKRFRAIGIGDVHICEQAVDGTLECWGANYWGMFGNATRATSATPVPAGGGVPYSAFVPFRWGVCALSEGEARCWGHGSDGEIGNGSMQDALSPATVAGNYRFTALEANGTADVICGLADTGRAYCWGRGIFGQLGNGAFLVSGVPAQVRLVREPAVAAGAASVVGPVRSVEMPGRAR
jgi:alpha-tubulin suppressor-like RCC1 family protein